MYINLLKDLRQEAGKTKLEVADYLSIQASTYSKYEAGIDEPDFRTLVTLAEYYNITIDYLLEKLKEHHIKRKPLRIPVYAKITADTPFLTSKDINDVQYDLYKADVDTTDLTESEMKEVNDFIKHIKERRNKEINKNCT